MTEKWITSIGQKKREGGEGGWSAGGIERSKVEDTIAALDRELFQRGRERRTNFQALRSSLYVVAQGS